MQKNRGKIFWEKFWTAGRTDAEIEKQWFHGLLLFKGQVHQKHPAVFVFSPISAYRWRALKIESINEFMKNESYINEGFH